MSFSSFIAFILSTHQTLQWLQKHFALFCHHTSLFFRPKPAGWISSGDVFSVWHVHSLPSAGPVKYIHHICIIQLRCDLNKTSMSSPDFKGSLWHHQLMRSGVSCCRTWPSPERKSTNQITRWSRPPLSLFSSGSCIHKAEWKLWLTVEMGCWV